MTCIVGYANGHDVWMGGDGVGVDGCYVVQTVARPKVFKKEVMSHRPNGLHSEIMLMGYTTSFRMGQILEHLYQPSQHSPEMGVDEYMMTVFVKQVRELLKEHGWLTKKDEQERGGQFLVGYIGRLWMMDSDFQLTEPGGAYSAVGSGYQLALGTMATFELLPGAKALEPRQRIRCALEVAARHMSSVGEPFTIISTELG